MADNLISKRIEQLVEVVSAGNKSEFARVVGISEANVRNYIAGKLPKFDTLFALVEKLEINAEWLLSGEGEIFKTKSTKTLIKENDKTNDKDFDKERKLQNSVSNTPSKKIVRDLAESLSNKLKGSTGGYIEVPLVDIEAAAGGGAPNADFIEEAENIRFPLSLLHHATGKLLCINVVGESMEPTLFDGSLVVIRLIDRSHWGSIRSGDVYVITDREGATYIKRVRNKLRSHGVLIMTSDNPDHRRYKPFERAEDEILNVWAVELVISNNVPPSDREIDELRDQIDDLRTMIERLVDREN